MAVIVDSKDTFAVSEDCFGCGKPIGNPPYIYWQGANGEGIALHPDCSKYLGLSLFGDFLAHQSLLPKGSTVGSER